jgi:superfamily II DNA or RNA helicase
MGVSLRGYQEDAVSAVRDEWASGNRATLLVLATGTGKTVIFSDIARRCVERGNGVLVLAHRGELVDQAAGKLAGMLGVESVPVEKASRHWDDHGTWDGMACVASVQTLQGRRLDEFPLESFKALVVDEAHHAVAASYRRIIDRHKAAGGYLLGVTATADRADRRGLSEVFDSIAYEYPLARAVADGYLVPITAKCIPLRIDLGGVRVSHGDFQANDLGSALDPYLPEIARVMAAECAGRKTVCFLPLVATAKRMADELNAAGLRATCVSGYDTPEGRERGKRMFREGEYDVLCNSMLFTEGWDEPAVDCVVVLRPTKSRSLYCLDEQTEVLTREGWKKDVEIGEEVLAFDKDTGATRFVPTLAKVRRPLESDEFFCSIKGQSTDIRVTNHHRMIYDHKRRTGWKFKEAQDLAKLKDGAYLPVCGVTNHFPGVPLTDAELTFIGWVMTDGTINKSNNAITITQSSHQVEYCAEIEECIKGCGFKFGKQIRKRTKEETHFNVNSDLVVWTISKGKPRGRDKHLTGWARLEPWLSKDLSPKLFDMTSKQFSVMLEAIYHGDENKSWKSTYHIGKGNKTFIERLQIMGIQRGYRASVSIERANEVRKSDLWYLHIKKTEFVKVGSISEKHSTWTEEPHTDEMCWCVENELGTLVTRRNGKVAIVGNCQMVGRGTRLSPGKERLLLLDFLWMTERHDLARPASLLGKEPRVAEIMAERAEDGGEWDLQELAEEAERDARAEREAALARELAKQRKKKKKLVDPLQFATSIQELDLSDYVPTKLWEFGDVTEKQRETLEKFGVDGSTCENAGQASLLIDACFRRVDSGLATARQIRCLERAGFEHVGTWGIDAAKAVIGKLAACSWNTWMLRQRYGIDPATYDPRKEGAE